MGDELELEVDCEALTELAADNATPLFCTRKRVVGTDSIFRIPPSTLARMKMRAIMALLSIPSSRFHCLSTDRVRKRSDGKTLGRDESSKALEIWRRGRVLGTWNRRNRQSLPARASGKSISSPSTPFELSESDSPPHVSGRIGGSSSTQHTEAGMDYNASSSEVGTNGEVVEMSFDLPINITCHPLNIPSIEEYFTAFNEWGVALFTLGGLAVLIVLSLYADTMRYVVKNAPTASKAHTAFVISVYPVVAMATYCATIVPRAQLLAEALTQGMFMACLYQLFCLFVSYCGGEAQLINKVHPNLLSLQVMPCCCWPCFSICLPTFPVTKKCMLILRLLVLQLPVVQGLIYVTLLVMWAEEQSLYHLNYTYFQPVMFVSILTGIWGMVMTTTMLMPIFKDHLLQGKFLALQMVLILAKLQGFIAKFVARADVFPCRHPITPTVYTNLIYNSAILWEMVLLCALARYLYKKPLPLSYTTDTNSNIKVPKQICTILDEKSKIDAHNGNVKIMKF